MSVPPIHYAIYTRQSSHSENVMSSCDAQFSMCQDFVRCRAAPNWHWIGERLDDVGESGGDMQRQGLRRLLHLVDKGRVDKVAIYRLDRLSRRLRDSLYILDTLRQAEVELLIVTAPEIGSAATDTFLLNLMAIFAEFERDIIRARMGDAREALKRQGRRLAGPVPYGYDSDPQTKQLVVNSREARRVEAIFQMAADGMPPRDIASTVNENGWRTKHVVAEQSGKEHGSNLWSPRQILAILANPTYIGMFRDGDDVRYGRHQPIVARELWDRAREQIDARRTTKRPHQNEQHFWALRGKIRCPGCGRMMGTHATHQSNVIYRHYRCRSHSGGRPPCKGQAFPAHELEEGIAKLLSKPDLASTSDDPNGEDHILLSRFAVAWALLDRPTQKRMLPEIIEEVSYHEADSLLELSLDMDAIRRLIDSAPPDSADEPPSNGC